jgi:hypothetical protein
VQVLSEGQRLRHDQYGLGVVTESDPERTSIEFDDHGPKLFVTSMMKAQLVGEAPPKKTKARRRRAPKVSVAPIASAQTKLRRTRAAALAAPDLRRSRTGPGRRRRSS